MRKIWLIATSTYLRRVRTGSFLFLTFGLPVFMVLAGALPLLLQGGGEIPERVGYVDQTGLLQPISQVTMDEITLDRVYLWQGEQDANVPVSMGRAMAQAIPNCQAKFYPGEAHMSVIANHIDEIVSTF